MVSVNYAILTFEIENEEIQSQKSKGMCIKPYRS